jgi:hypothetical protein
MASPFHHFRRHQKKLLGVFGVLIMFVFVVGSALQELMDTNVSQRRQGEQKAVTWDGGALSENEMYQASQTHQQVVTFLATVARETLQREGRPIAPGFSMTQTGQIQHPGIPVATNEQTIVETMLLAQRARSMGMVVSDDAIFDFLENQLSVGLLTRGDLARILSESTRLTDAQMFDALRIELLAQNMRLMGQSALFADRRPIVTPAAAWDYHLRLNRRAQVELLPIQVADYVDQVKQQPTQAELQQLFDKHKEQFSFPSSPEPGFKQRQKLAFEYIKARLEDFRQRELANITEEQIQEEYEQRVTQGRYRVTPPSPAADDPQTLDPAVPTPE